MNGLLKLKINKLIMSNVNLINQNEQWKLLVLLLKEVAESKKITQEQIANETGMLQSAISRFFSLKFKPTLDTFLQISKSIKVNFFFEDQENKSDLNQCFEQAMEALGRRENKLPKN
jgi:transcriptional regulator with XRE-family HTH domain